MAPDNCDVTIATGPTFLRGGVGHFGAGLIRVDYSISCDPNHVTITAIEMRISTDPKHPDLNRVVLARSTYSEFEFQDGMFKAMTTALIPNDYKSDTVRITISIDYQCDGTPATKPKTDHLQFKFR